MRDLPIRAMARSHTTEKRKMVRPAGFEPATLGSEDRRPSTPSVDGHPTDGSTPVE